MTALDVASERCQTGDWRARLPRLHDSLVLLRELEPTDAPALNRLVRDPRIARETWPPPASAEAFERFIEWTWRERADGRYVCFGVVPQGAVDVAGILELRALQPEFFRAEVGVVLDSSLWGTGVFAHASRLLFEFAFDVLRVHRIEARVSVDNVRSNAALRKLGARHEGVLRAAFVSDSKFIDQNLWAIVNGLDRAASPVRSHSCFAAGNDGR